MSLLSYDPFFEYVLDTPRVFSPLGFGFDPFEELTPFTSPFGLPRRFTPRGMRAPTTRPTTREVISDKDKYQVNLKCFIFATLFPLFFSHNTGDAESKRF